MPLPTAPRDHAFSFRRTRDGKVLIHQNGALVTTLTGTEAGRFFDRVTGKGDDVLQSAAARVTGNYRRGNESTAANHARNRRK